MENSLKRAYTEKEAAFYIGMSRSFLAQARMQGNQLGQTPAPPFVRRGRKILYLREELDRWLDDARVGQGRSNQREKRHDHPNR